MSTAQSDATEAAILNRILRPEEPSFSPEGARDILGLGFAESDKARMRELSAKAREGTLSPAEDAEAARYELLGHLLGILQSKARRSLRARRGEVGQTPGTA